MATCVAYFRKSGVCIRNVEIQSGEVAMNLNETMLSKSKSSSTISSQTDTVPNVDSVTTKKMNKKQAAVAALMKKAPLIPEQVCLMLSYRNGMKLWIFLLD